MTREDFMGIEAVRSLEIRDLFRRSLDGLLTKSEFVEQYVVLPHTGRGKKKQRKAKQAVWQADRLEKYFGWIWK